MWCEGYSVGGCEPRLMWWCVFCCVCGVNGARLALFAYCECDVVMCGVQYV